MKKWLLGIAFTMLSAMLVLGACGSQDGGNENEGAESGGSDEGGGEKITLKIGVPGADTHPFTVGAEHFKEAINEASDDAFDVQIFSNGQMGGERELAEAAKVGTLDMAVVTVDGAVPAWIPEGQVFTLPYIVENRDQAYGALNGELGDYLNEKASEQGWNNLGYWELGFRNFTNDVRPIEKPEDLEGLKIRVQESPVWVTFIETLNASPTPIAFDELYTSLSQGVVDGQENPLPTINDQKYYEVQKYLSLDRHTFAPSYVLFNQESWDNLSDEHQQIIQEAVDETQPYVRNYVEEESEKLRAELEEKGMEITEPDLDAFQEATKDIPEKVSDIIPEEVVEMLKNGK